MPKGYRKDGTKLGFQKGEKHSEEHKRKIALSMTNKKLSEQVKRKLSLLHIGMKASKETKQKMAKTRKGKAHPHIGVKGWHHSEEFKRKASLLYKGKHRSEETKRRMRVAHIKYMASGKMKFKDTSIELKIENELKSQAIPFIKQAPVEGVALVDFLLPNKVIIQADGKYWHRKELNNGKDICQDTILGFKGYKIYRFTETEINKSPKRCIERFFKVGGKR